MQTNAQWYSQYIHKTKLGIPFIRYVTYNYFPITKPLKGAIITVNLSYIGQFNLEVNHFCDLRFSLFRICPQRYGHIDGQRLVSLESCVVLSLQKKLATNHAQICLVQLSKKKLILQYYNTRLPVTFEVRFEYNGLQPVVGYDQGSLNK